MHTIRPLTNCCKRKREFRVHEVLSNGQHLCMYFIKYKNSEPDGIIHGVWTVGLCIAASKKQANRWFLKKGRKDSLDITGDCGLEGLKRALDILLWFANQLSPSSELQVGYRDDRRKSAYRRLLKYGFKEYEDHYSIRNPKYWLYLNTAQ